MGWDLALSVTHNPTEEGAVCLRHEVCSDSLLLFVLLSQIYSALNRQG